MFDNRSEKSRETHPHCLGKEVTNILFLGVVCIAVMIWKAPELRLQGARLVCSEVPGISHRH
jgi:hypothetical protein